MLVTNYTVTAIGILSSGLQVALNIHIVYKYLIPSPAWKKHDFRFIIFRTFIDILQGFAGVAYFSSIIPYVLRPDLFSFNYLFVSGLILTNITIVRSFLAAGIAIERCFASIFPIQFFKHRQKMPNTPLFLFFISTALFDDLMLFHFINFPLDPKNCTTYLCAVPEYWRYGLIYSAFYAFINYFFSFILCFKLLLMYFRKHSYSDDLKKINILCLTDGLSSIIFDLIPAIIIQIYAIKFENYGPVTGVLRTVGRLFEALVMYKLMKPKITSPKSNSMHLKIPQQERTSMRF